MMIKIFPDHKNYIFKRILSEMLENPNQSDGCDDLVLPNTSDTLNHLNAVFLYGVSEKWWDDECPPSVQDDKIYWWRSCYEGFIKALIYFYLN